MAVWWLETSRHREPEDLPCRRTELEEGDVILHELPKHVKVRTGRCRSASWEFSSPGYSQLLPSYQRTETITDRLRPVTLWEPPYADPHVRWCGGWGGEPPGYPIGRFFNSTVYLRAIGSPKVLCQIQEMEF